MFKNNHILLFFCLIILSCSSEEQKMQKIIKGYLYKTLDDYKSYEPIEFQPSDSLFSDWTMDPMLPVLEALNEKYSHQKDSLKREMDRKRAYGYSAESILSSDWNDYVEATFFTTMRYKSIRDSIKNHFVSEFIGFGIDHSFRAKNRLGATIRNNYQFIIDPSKTAVIEVRDIDEGEAIRNYAKILNKDELDELKHQEMLKKYPNYKERGEAFLEQNKNKEGVVVTPSGLQYRVVKEGVGKKPRQESEVEIKYILKTFEGEIIDNAQDEGVNFKIRYITEGFAEALKLMSPGAVYEVFIPYELGYGDKGYGNFPPYCVTIAEIELLKIVKY